MLPEFYRFRVVNNTDQTFTFDNAARIELNITPWKMTSGAMAQGAIISDTTAFLNTGESIIATAEVEGAVIDNTSNLFMGFTGTFYGKADVTSTDGSLDLYVEFSTDNSRWPSDMADFDIVQHCILIAQLVFSTDAADEDAAVNVQF
jgi:hypothetical protein